jgi:hypothetical protein
MTSGNLDMLSPPLLIEIEGEDGSPDTDEHTTGE